ncbi:putative polysaccharide biosynthesis protein [Alkalihalobacillus sp. 1P02AB]|uniref:putative polysaccharide biosynthesis protein n=1 Tax=Alkalihalobacillus sp. 1P02AB TaxID=3132260 RepID=UPI0039A42A40
MRGVRQADKGEDFLRGALLLSIAAIVAKILSAAYRIPYQNIAGDLGFYVYQQIYPFYGLMVTLSMYGFPVVLSKQIAEYRASGEREGLKAFVSLAFYGLLLVAVLATICLYFFAPAIAHLMGDVALTEPLRAVSFVFLLMPFLSIGRGITQGQQNMLPTALSQVSEQFVRVVGILIFAIILLSLDYGPYGAGVGAAYGSLVGGVAAIVVLFFCSRKIVWSDWFQLKEIRFGVFLKQSISFFKQSFFICMGALTFIFFQFVDVFSMIRLLEGYGLDSAAAYYTKSLYDRGQPILQLGTIVTTTFALALVPLLSKARSEKNQKQMVFYRNLTLRVTILIAGVATLGLIVIMEPLNSMLFTDRIGSDVLKVFSLAVFTSAIYMTGAAILQGYGQVHLPAIAVVIGVGLKLLLNLMFIPLYGSYGAAYATVFSFVVMASSMLYGIYKHDQSLWGKGKPYAAVLLTFVALYATTTIWGTFLGGLLEPSRLHDTILALSTVVIGAVTVSISVIVLPVFNDKEWESIPKLNKMRARFRKI